MFFARFDFELSPLQPARSQYFKIEYVNISYPHLSTAHNIYLIYLCITLFKHIYISYLFWHYLIYYFRPIQAILTPLFYPAPPMAPSTTTYSPLYLNPTQTGYFHNTKTHKISLFVIKTPTPHIVSIFSRPIQAILTTLFYPVPQMALLYNTKKMHTQLGMHLSFHFVIYL